ncbi:MAG: Mut7-C ubiquitin/RNAse domain-containing protein [Desulfobacterota bacterium]|jgi:hypothetical protein|nr:Mut7-C ubiquitin/RNAse domain-containing protein [Thermodesulfobacteriota bacterium]
MGKVLIRFYEELNEFLPADRRKRDLEIPLKRRKGVRELIETLGVPTAQVDLLLINGRSAALDDVVREGDRISVYPVFERFNIRGVSRVREKPLRKLKFIVDSDLKLLGQAMGRLGLDVRFRDDLETGEILRAAKAEHRILLTRRNDLSRLQTMDRVIVIRTGSLEEQVREVTDALDLRVEAEQEVP